MGQTFTGDDMLFHMVVVGWTGSGKTNAVLHMLMLLLDKKERDKPQPSAVPLRPRRGRVNRTFARHPEIGAEGPCRKQVGRLCMRVLDRAKKVLGLIYEAPASTAVARDNPYQGGNNS